MLSLEVPCTCYKFLDEDKIDKELLNQCGSELCRKIQSQEINNNFVSALWLSEEEQD